MHARTLHLRDGSKLLARPPAGSDGAALFAVLSDPRLHIHNPAGPTRDPEEAELRLASWIGDWQRDGLGYWAVVDDGSVLGFGGVRRTEHRGALVLNLYYRLAAETWGRGIATELARAAIGLADEQAPGLAVIARTRPGNDAAATVAKRAGLVRAPELDDELLAFSRLAPRAAARRARPRQPE